MIAPATQSLRDRYHQDGIVFPIPVLSLEEATRYRQACDDLEAHLGGKPRTIEVRQMHLHFRWAYDLATHPRVLDAVEGLLGPNLLVWATELFAKHPQDAAVSIGWHRDRSYMGFDAATTTTAWIALGNSTVANGCMRAVPGPARRADRALSGIRRDHPREAKRQMAVEVNEKEVVDVVLAAGEMSLHDSDILHGSGANLSKEKRVGFVVRYVTPEARPPQGRPPVVLARGRDDLGRFELVGPPAETTAEEAIANLKASALLHFDSMLQTLRRADA